MKPVSIFPASLLKIKISVFLIVSSSSWFLGSLLSVYARQIPAHNLSTRPPWRSKAGLQSQHPKHLSSINLWGISKIFLSPSVNPFLRSFRCASCSSSSVSRDPCSLLTLAKFSFAAARSSVKSRLRLWASWISSSVGSAILLRRIRRGFAIYN